ncbi:MAG TPA: maleylpyruvate isomerase N-terminal domain-containing protein [Anaerolineae bacterium]|nr:maleylpyruvate isomerase N-terminal domain-containing protein [Anaerolineae bacterium]
MHTADVLMYGHRTFMHTLQEFPASQRYASGAVGYWSVKDLAGHLGSFELVLAEILEDLISPHATPLRDALIANGEAFNNEQVDVARKSWTYEQCLEEYRSAHDQVRALASRLPADVWRQTGAIAWYGANYDLEDLIAYQYYGHKREHSGQIQTFRDRLR